MPREDLRRFTDPDGRPFERRDLCHLLEGDGWWRWEITTRGSLVDLIRRLAGRWEPPFVLLYVLVVSRGPQEGRYQSPDLEGFQSVDNVLAEYRDLLERDGRHELWVHQRGTARKAILSRNDVLHVYGDRKAGHRLHADGYGKARPPVPLPHAHNYHDEFDEAERRLLARWAWSRTPLRAGDGN